MKIWHDNSGKGDNASWFLKIIIVHDLQTKEKFYFLCQDWLALEKSDGKIQRELFVACKPQQKQLEFLMKKQAKNYLVDQHLWLSVFNRPIQSTFTRLDRVTCCFVFHYLSMLLNALYYERDSPLIDITNTNVINVSVFNLKNQQVRNRVLKPLLKINSIVKINYLNLFF
jgi:polycystin 1L2